MSNSWNDPYSSLPLPNRRNWTCSHFQELYSVRLQQHHPSYITYLLNSPAYKTTFIFKWGTLIWFWGCLYLLIVFVVVYGVTAADITYSRDDVRSIEGDVLYSSCSIIVNILLKCEKKLFAIHRTKKDGGCTFYHNTFRTKLLLLLLSLNNLQFFFVFLYALLAFSGAKHYR